MGRVQTEPVSAELAVSLGPAPGQRMVETPLLLVPPASSRQKNFRVRLRFESHIQNHEEDERGP